MKCNSSEEVLRTLAAYGSGFEVASLGELRMLQDDRGRPGRGALQQPDQAAGSTSPRRYKAGLWRFSFDSEGELHKLAQHAPGSAVYIRLRVDDSTSIFPLSRKFGAEAYEARAPAAAGPRARAPAVRGDVPRRLAVRHDRPRGGRRSPRPAG